MFGNKNSKEAQLKKYDRLLEESYKLSTINRKESDAKRTEAEAILVALGMNNMRTP